MKTLDEVIGFITERKAQYDEVGCFYCHYSNHVDCVGGCVLADALHYLKEYRETVANCNQLRTGIWIPVDGETVNGRCSVCGYESHLYENDVYGEHYCPNCGAWLRLT